MVDNPRDLIRAAQSAELRGEPALAAESLLQAAAIYRKAGNTARALQLLRHARQLDGNRVDIAEEVHRLEWMPETLIPRALSPEDVEDSRLATELERSLENAPLPELARRQRLVEDSLREARRRGPEPETAQSLGDDSLGARLLQAIPSLVEEGGGPEQLSVVSPWAGDSGTPRRAITSPVRSELAGSEAARLGQSSLVEVGPAENPRPAKGGGGVERPGSSALLEDREPERMVWRPQPEAGSEVPASDAPSRRARRERNLIERGPTRADPALHAWCSFCCRPREEVGDVVAGPAGAFICKGCLTESASLLGDVAPPPAPARARPIEPVGATLELVGHADALALLDRSLAVGVRCLLVVGPVGSGKSTWFQMLHRQGRGVLTPVSSLDGATSPLPLLVEDVDRLDAEAQERLAAFLARHPGRTVLLSARGSGPETDIPVLRDGQGRVPVPTSAVLSEAVRGTVPTTLLEHVQVLLPLRTPSRDEFMEIARKRLALREPAVSLSDDVLAAFATEAVRSPRAGHELQALLHRVPAGTWSLDTAAKPARSSRDKGRRKGRP